MIITGIWEVPAQSYSGQNGSIKQSAKITWLTIQRSERIWSSWHLSESFQVCSEDIQVICSSTASGNRFWWLPTLSRKWTFLLFYVKVYVGTIYIYMHLFIKMYEKRYLLIYLSVQPLQTFNFFISLPHPTHRLNTSCASLLTWMLRRSEWSYNWCKW